VEEKQMRELGMILALITGMRAMTANDGDLQHQPVQVCLNPGGNARIVYSAEAIASRIFAAIGVELLWQSDVRYCASEKAGVLISFEEPARDRSSATLAYASPYGESHIVVYLTRLRETVSPQSVSALLAHVMVHEIAHILQGVDQHSPEGMMKQRWTTRDLADMRWRSLPFSAGEILQIHRGLQRRNAVAMAQSR
jgi:hypothetical protein